MHLRESKIRRVAALRQTDLTVVLENVHDPHNVSAIVRSCDAIGVPAIFVLYSDTRLHDARLWLGKHSTAGSRKWVKVQLYRQSSEVIPTIKARYQRLLGATSSPGPENLFDVDLTLPTAVVLGNEESGISAEVIKQCDSLFNIPLVGMVESLNVSVAASVILYEAFRQRCRAGRYAVQGVDPFPEDHQSLLQDYLAIGLKKRKPQRKFYID